MEFVRSLIIIIMLESFKLIFNAGGCTCTCACIVCECPLFSVFTYVSAHGIAAMMWNV